jgi:hypothetical protein
MHGVDAVVKRTHGIMADSEAPKKGEIVKIPAISSIAGRVTVHRDGGKALWARSGILVFLMALALPVLPLVLLVLLLRQPDTGPNGLIWVWVTMIVITELIALLVAYGLVRTVLESDAS